MAERRLAISIKGGVSLGAYEAGVLTETLRLIAFNNQQALRRNPPGVPWYIDTFAGASAGSITAAIAARILVDNSPLIRQNGNRIEPGDLLRQLWVEDISLDLLLTNPPDNTLLDSGAVTALTAEYFAHAPLRAARHPTIRPGPDPTQVGLVLTLSALDPGLEHTETLNGFPLDYHEYARLARFQIEITGGGALAFQAFNTGPLGYREPGDMLQGDLAFETLVKTALTSGAFPLAFAPRGLARRDAIAWGDRYFVDGGVYDNDPVGEMINLAHDLDWDSQVEVDDTDRRFLVVETEPPIVDQALKGSPIPRTDLLDISVANFASTLVGQIIEESMGRGLRGIGETNRKIQKRNLVLSGIAEHFAALQGSGFDFPSLTGRLRAIVELLAPIYQLRFDRLQLFRRFFLHDLAALSETLSRQAAALDTNASQAFVEFGLLYDLVSELADKVPFHPIVIGPAKKLSGAELLAFGGFFLKELRAHDFDQGRADAYSAWEKISKRPGETFILSPDRPAPPGEFNWTEDLKHQFKNASDRFQARIRTVVQNAVEAQLPPIPIIDRILSGVIASIADIIIKRFINSNN
jgi:Patatin-like phospholipase